MPGISLGRRSVTAGGRPTLNRSVDASTGNRAAGLAHDARNLLSALSLYCELLATPGVLAPRFRHYAEDLRRVGETGARLIEGVAETLAGNRLDPASDIPLSAPRHPFPGIQDLGSEVRSMEQMLRSLAGPGLRVEVECAPCAGELALNSEDLLRILFNLLANAVEAMHLQGKRSASSSRRTTRFVRITAQRGGGASFLPPGAGPLGTLDTVVLSVRDNGPGIAAETLARIFDPGFTTRCASGEGGGRGLGLAIVRQLVEAAGGAVRAVSSPGLGTRFDIEIPILPATAQGVTLPTGGRKASPEKRMSAGNTGIGKYSTASQERRVLC